MEEQLGRTTIISFLLRETTHPSTTSLLDLRHQRKVHEILRQGLADSPLYNGQINSIGPRYCPSIETKLVTFPDRDSHPLFLEPEGTDTNEMYLNGFSSSMPWDIQLEALHHIPALRDAKYTDQVMP